MVALGRGAVSYERGIPVGLRVTGAPPGEHPARENRLGLVGEGRRERRGRRGETLFLRRSQHYVHASGAREWIGAGQRREHREDSSQVSTLHPSDSTPLHRVTCRPRDLPSA